MTPKPKPPSIPDHKKAFVKNKNYCTGIGLDTVGPQFYRPNLESVHKRFKKVDFYKDNTIRRLWEPTKN